MTEGKGSRGSKPFHAHFQVGGFFRVKITRFYVTEHPVTPTYALSLYIYIYIHQGPIENVLIMIYRTTCEHTLALHRISQKQIMGMESTKYATSLYYSRVQSTDG